MITTTQIYWLAGLLEGEGSFQFSKGSGPGCPSIQLTMTDEDIVAKARNLIDKTANIRIYNDPRPNHKVCYIIKIHGKPAIEWMYTLYSLMGRRRKEKIREVIQLWKEMPGKFDGSYNLEISRTIKSLAKLKNISYEEARIAFYSGLNSRGTH